jgi:tetratricopeptide (TPR) repeat protein
MADNIKLLNPLLRALCVAALIVGLTGCAGSLEHWIVNTRVNQGDVALDRGSLHEAETAYRLALRVNPHDPRARSGFSQVAAAIAEADYRKGNFDDAKTMLNEALKYDPQSVRLQALRSQIDDARLKREIVSSNYPTYQGAGVQMQDAYASLNVQTKSILRDLKRFSYTYDTQDLTKAIQASYEMQLDVAKNTNRLIAYRQLVESGVPAATAGTPTSAASGSLLPLP